MLVRLTNSVLALLVILLNAVPTSVAVVVAIVLNELNCVSIAPSFSGSNSNKLPISIFSPLLSLPNFSLNHLTMPQSPIFSSSHPLMSSIGFQSPNKSAALSNAPLTAPAGPPRLAPPTNKVFINSLILNPENLLVINSLISPNVGILIKSATLITVLATPPKAPAPETSNCLIKPLTSKLPILPLI